MAGHSLRERSVYRSSSAPHRGGVSPASTLSAYSHPFSGMMQRLSNLVRRVPTVCWQRFTLVKRFIFQRNAYSSLGVRSYMSSPMLVAGTRTLRSLHFSTGGYFSFMNGDRSSLIGLLLPISLRWSRQRAQC